MTVDSRHEGGSISLNFYFAKFDVLRNFDFAKFSQISRNKKFEISLATLILGGGGISRRVSLCTDIFFYEFYFLN
jgi:hypothetical protein